MKDIYKILKSEKNSKYIELGMDLFLHTELANFIIQNTEKEIEVAELKAFILRDFEKMVEPKIKDMVYQIINKG